jgi:hypothetical protein
MKVASRGECNGVSDARRGVGFKGDAGIVESVKGSEWR